MTSTSRWIRIAVVVLTACTSLRAQDAEVDRLRAAVDELLAVEPQPLEAIGQAWVELAEAQYWAATDAVPLDRERLDEAARCAVRALAAAENSVGTCSRTAAGAHFFLALCREEDARPAEAIPAFEAALEAMERLEPRDVRSELGAWSGLGRSAYLVDRYGLARRAYTSMLELAESHAGPASPKAIEARSGLAVVYGALGDGDRAFRLCARNVAEAESFQGDDRRITADARIDLCRHLLRAGETQRALEQMELAIAEHELVDGERAPGVLAARGDYATILEANGRLDDAEAVLRLSLESQPGEFVIVRDLNNLALLRAKRGDPAEALAILTPAVARCSALYGPSNRRTWVFRNNRGAMLRTVGRYAEAWDECIAVRTGQQEFLESVYGTLSDAARLELCEDDSLSVQSLMMLVPLVSTPEHERSAYDAVRAWKGSVERSLTGDRARGAARTDARLQPLVDAMAELQRRASREVWSGAAATEAGRDRLAEIADERGAIDQQIAQHVTAAPPTAAHETAPWPTNTARIDFLVHDAWIPSELDGARVVTPGRIGDPVVTAWIARGGSDAVVRVALGDANGARALVDALAPSGQDAAREVGGHVAPAAIADAASELWQRLWAPLAPHLAGVDTVYVSPDAFLHRLPLGVLRAPNGRHLVEDVRFVVAGEGGRAAEPDDGDGAASLLLVGDLTYGASAVVDATARATVTERAPAPMLESIPALPGTRDEIERVRRGFRAGHSGGIVALTGERGTEERVRRELGRHSYAHIATHGLYLERTELRGLPGLLSAFACAGIARPQGGAGDDGLLTAEELSFLDLSGVELVVLSGCETARGWTQSGEPPVGLASTLLRAGCRAVVSSVWKVPDVATAEFMERFYRALWSGDVTPGDALRRAQIETIARNREEYGDARPETWGGFVVLCNVP